MAGIGQGGAFDDALKGVATAVGVVYRAFGVGYGQRGATQAQLQLGKVAVADGGIFPICSLYIHLSPGPHRFLRLSQPAQGAQTESRLAEQPGLGVHR